MRIGSLFSGIGGLELGLEWSGLGRTIWQVEADAFCRAVLAKHWPNVDRSIVDVRNAGPSVLAPVDVLCGGFPCQDVSSAGAHAGLAGQRSGLWREFRRCVSEFRPRIAIVENVASGARRWLCPVRDDLHQLGYRTRAVALSAADVGAPHLRRRVFVIAYANGEGEPSIAIDAEVGRASETRRDHWRGPRPNMVRMVHGLPRGLDRRRRALGNSVVPQCAAIIGEVAATCAQSPDEA